MNLRVKPGILKDMSENGPVLPPGSLPPPSHRGGYCLLAIILLLVAGVTSMVGTIIGKRDAAVASTATPSGAPFQSFSARPPKLLRLPRPLAQLLLQPRLRRLLLRQPPRWPLLLHPLQA